MTYTVVRSDTGLVIVVRNGTESYRDVRSGTAS